MRDMEKRLREYELRGVQASSSLQTAARSVMRENARLRSLLRRVGVKDAEVEAHLQVDMHTSDDGGSDRHSAPSNLPHSGPFVCGQEDLTASSSSTSHQEHLLELPQQNSARKAQPPKLACVMNGRGDAACPRPCAHSITSSDQHIESQRSQAWVPRSTLQDHSVRLDSSTERPEKDKGAQKNMTPCIEAAMIIASMNSGLSMEEVNAELGCPPANDCYVDNLTVFRVMDR